MVLWPTSDDATPEQSIVSFHRLGQCKVLALDTYNAFIRPDGKQAGDETIVSDASWGAIEKALSAEGMKRLLVISPVPIVECSPEEAKKLGGSLDRQDIRERWSFHTADQLKLLQLLFEWQISKENLGQDRQSLLLCGGCKYGCKTRVMASKGPERVGSALDQSFEIQQLIVGPLASGLGSPEHALEGRVYTEDFAGVRESTSLIDFIRMIPSVPAHVCVRRCRASWKGGRNKCGASSSCR